MATSKYNAFTLYRRLLRGARSYWPHIGGIFLVGILSTPLTLLNPLPLKIAVDSVIGSRPIPGFLEVIMPVGVSRSGKPALVLAVILLVAIALVSQLLLLGKSLLRAYTGEKLVMSFRTNLFRHVQRLSLSYHDTKGITDSLYRIQYDAPAIQWILIDGIAPFITAGLSLVGMIYVTFRIDRQLALIAIAISPILLVVSGTYKPRLRSKWRQVKNLESSAFSVVQEVLAGLRVVKAFGQEDREEERFTQHASKGVWARIRATADEAVFGLLVGLTTATGTAAVLFIGVRRVQTGALTLGDLLLVMGYIVQLFGPLASLSRMTALIQNSLASAERAFSLLDEAPDVLESGEARPLPRTSGSVIFRNVYFAYEKNHPVLHNISFEIPFGSRVGIKGATGAGKTTLVSLLTRFYDPEAGQILLDGVDLRDYKVADLRNQFAIVLQEPVLFSSSIAENIAYADPDASKDKIIEAAKAANAHEFIVELPNGYNTLVGERGMRLSGGERQRIALSRAFLKDAPILILDEPTSSVDMKTEAGIIEAMERLMNGRTAFIIAHRLSTIKNCEVWLKIEHGRLVEVDADSETDNGGVVSDGKLVAGVGGTHAVGKP
jgi:ATP-binding cassette subfamily B protein